MVKWYPVSEKNECIRQSLNGAPYEEITCLYPFLQPYHLKQELTYDPLPVLNFMDNFAYLPTIVVGLYAILIYYGQEIYFKKKQPLNWRSTMALWNLLLSVFSFIGLCRVLPQFIHNYTTYTIKENFCFNPESSYGSGPPGLWVVLFIFSKFPELLDTFFIVIHKKKLIFLHWYHHISVLLYCWHSFKTRNPVGIIFCVMNYAVHSFMYFYYFLMAINKKPKFLDPVYVTIAQISQMIVGVAVTIVSIYYIKFDTDNLQNVNTDQQCHLREQNVIAALIMYGSYLLLFLEFFLGRYFKSSTKKVPISSTATSKSTGLTNGSTYTNGATNGTSKKIAPRKEE